MRQDKRTAPKAPINENISAREVRLIGADGEQIGIVSIDEALRVAEEAKLDLVEISADAVPPVCRIMDYGKFKYEASKRAADAKKKTARVEIKEVKMRPKTEEHDFQVKLRNVRRFLENGDKVKVTVMFRGREVTHPEFGAALMERVSTEIGELGLVEMTPRMAGRFMTMVLAPKKK